LQQVRQDGVSFDCLLQCFKKKTHPASYADIAEWSPYY